MSKSELQPIEQKVKERLVQQFGSTTIPLVAGVSGGPDSMGLLHIFKRLGSHIVVVHINYEKREEQAKRDQRLVEETAELWNFPCKSIKVGKQLDSSSNFQAQARDLRYQYFERIRKQREARAVAVAHHEDDQLETILHKLLRGSGMDGWSGMSVYQNKIFRPLLDCPKERINSYIDAWDIPHRIDKTNLRSVYARNFLRNEWIPQLNHWFPGWRDNILRLSDISHQFSSVVDALIDAAESDPGDLKRSMVVKWNEEVRKGVFLRLIKKYHPDVSISGSALQQLSNLDDLQTGQKLQLSDNLHILRDRKVFKLVSNMNLDPDKPAVKIDQADIKPGPKQCLNWHFAISTMTDPDFDRALYLDTEAINWPLTLRLWEAGDRFQPLGMKGTQKVKDHLTNRKISASRKSSARVVEDRKRNIIAVLFPPDEQKPPGTIADFCKCDMNTKEVLQINHHHENV